MPAMRYDEEAAARLLAIYRTSDVAAQRAQFLEALAPRIGERVLDVGSGPGLLALEIGKATGPSGAVCGVDISPPLVAAARALCARQPWIEFREADAMRLPFADREFDAVVSTQVLEYVPDVKAALAEMRRVLRPAGRAVIVDTDWDSIVWHSPDRARTERILAAWEQHATDPRLPRSLAAKLAAADLQVTSQRVLPLFNPCFATDTYSNRIIDLIVAFVAGRDGITRREAQDWARDLRQAGERGEYFFSLNRYLFVATVTGPVPGTPNLPRRGRGRPRAPLGR